MNRPKIFGRLKMEGYMGVTKTRIAGTIMVALLALSAPFVYADSGNGGNFGGSGWGHHGHSGRGGFFHNLTDDQKKQMKAIWEKQKEAKKAAFAQIKADKEALTNELLQTTPDANKINDLKSKMEALHAQMLDSRINSNLEVKKILTAEQFAKYLEIQKYKHSGRFHREEWGNRGEGFGGREGSCRHHRHHHGNWGEQRDGGHGYDNGDNE
jgi:Spy/CpxP family protein refolding chaperone